MSTLTKRNINTKGGNVSTPTSVGRRKLQLKNRKYGKQVSKLRQGQKVTATSERERQGIYDTLRSLNINSNFRSTSIGNGLYVISKKYSKK